MSPNDTKFHQQSGGCRPSNGAVRVALMALLMAACRSNHPSDAQLLRRFAEHRAELEMLRRMFVADTGLERVGSDFTRPQDPSAIGISTARIRRYREVCEHIGLVECVEGYGLKTIILFHASTEGLSVSGSSKGYAYFRGEQPGIVVSNLDSYDPRGGESFTVFRRVEGNWYLYYDVED